MARQPITRAHPYTPKSGKHAGETFTSERQYRNALARDKGQANLYRQQREPRVIGSATKFAELDKSEKVARARALDAVRWMRRDGMSLAQAARKADTTPNTVIRYAGAALDQRDGRYQPKPYDRLVRPMRFATYTGVRWLPIHDSRSARLVGQYWRAVRQYLDTGDTRAVQRFRGRSITVDKLAYPFVTEPEMLDLLRDAGELDFVTIYELAD